MKIRNKLLLSFLLVALLPVILVGGYLTIKMRTMAFQNASEQASINVDRVKKRTEEVLNVSLDISYRLSNDARLKRLANRQYESVYDVVEAYREYPDISEYIRLYKEISNIRLYTDNKTLLNNWELINASEEIKSSEWYQKAIHNIGLVGWEYIEDERDHKKYLSLVRKIELEGQNNYGMLVINVNSVQLGSILNQESFETMIVDGKNHIIASNRSERTNKELSDIGLDTSVLGQESGSYEALMDGKASKVIAPVMYMVKKGFAKKTETFVSEGGTFVTTFFSGIVNENDLVTVGGYPGELRRLMGIWAEEIDVLPTGQFNQMVMNKPIGKFEGSYPCELLFDLIHAESAEVLAEYGSDFYKGMPALTVNSFGKGQAYYVATSAVSNFLQGFLSNLCSDKGVNPLIPDIPVGVEASQRIKEGQSFLFLLNHNADAVTVNIGDITRKDLPTGETIHRDGVLPGRGVMILTELVCS